MQFHVFEFSKCEVFKTNYHITHKEAVSLVHASTLEQLQPITDCVSVCVCVSLVQASTPQQLEPLKTGYRVFAGSG